MLKKPHIIVIVILLIIVSCSKSKSSYFDVIQKSDKGILRGAEIGNTILEVQQLENKEFLVDNMPEYLYYDYKLDKTNSYTVSYDFAQEGLYAIELSVYFDNIEEANLIFADFNEYFTKIYGKSKVVEDGYTSWVTKSKKTGNNVEIAMINDSKEYGYVSVLISDLNY